jgi:ATP-dependent RNA helicase SUPV3L1/SUV3
MMFMADLIHGVEGLSTEDRMIFINAPASIREANAPRAKLLKELATCIGSQRSADLLTLQHLPIDILDKPTVGSKPRLKELEELHKGIVLYLWLSFRFPGSLMQRPLGNYVKEIVESEIEETLRLMTFKPGAVRRAEMRKRSGVEDEIMRIVREAEMKKAELEGEAAVKEGLVESGEGAGVVVGETMTEDDEGSYLEGDESAIEDEDGVSSGTDAAVGTDVESAQERGEGERKQGAHA